MSGRRRVQAVSRTFFATATPIATRIRITRSFFIDTLSPAAVALSGRHARRLRRARQREGPGVPVLDRTRR
jgi:hypothetical protein